ncbi:bifunctional DNA primase / polymerase [Corynebacterium phage CL31]|nr:bifunctional DNA primase / polymerase [Corynebacterium phage CL31]
MTISDTTVHSSDNELREEIENRAKFNEYFMMDTDLLKVFWEDGFNCTLKRLKDGTVHAVKLGTHELVATVSPKGSVVEFKETTSIPKRNDPKKKTTFWAPTDADMVEDLDMAAVCAQVFNKPDINAYIKRFNKDVEDRRKLERIAIEASLRLKKTDRKKPSTKVNKNAFQDAISSPLWQTRPWLSELNNISISARLNPYALLITVLGHVCLRVRPEIIMADPSDVSLNLFIMLLGKPGAGKGMTSKLAKKLVKFEGRENGAVDYIVHDYTDTQARNYPELVEETGWSGQGMARTFTWMRRAEQPDAWTPPHALFTESEVRNLTANASTRSSSQIPVMNKAFMGEMLGSANAEKANRYRVPAHTYRMAAIIEAQPDAVGALFDEHGGDDTGFTARLLVASPNIATRADIARVKEMQLEGAFPRVVDPSAIVEVPAQLCRDVKPNTHGLKPFPTDSAVMQLMEDALDDLAAVDGTNEDPTAGHIILIRRKVATLLAIASGDPAVTLEHWDMAGYVVKHSQDTLKAWREANKDKHREAGVAAKVNALQDEDEAAERDFQMKVDQCTNWVLSRGGCGLSELKRKGPIQGKWRTMTDTIIDAVVDTGKIARKEVKAGQYRLVPVL